MPMTRSISLAVFLLALLAAAPASAEDAKKIPGLLICSSFSAQPKTSPSWRDELNVIIDKEAITVESVKNPPPKGEVFKGLLAPSGAILIAGSGSYGEASWTYEFAGKFNKGGKTILRGKLTATKGVAGYRDCSMSF
jgi:hypothetical protein